MKRKICVIITARPSYSRIKTALKSINDHDKLELQLIVAGSALSDKYGSVVNYIIDDGFEIVSRILNVIDGENISAPAKTTGLGILEISTALENLKPDIVITIADRYETIANAIAASYMNIPLAHIQGGEVTGNIDEKVRHAITKLSDYHFVASDDAKERVVKLGENPNFVFNTGCPSIDLAYLVKDINQLTFDPYSDYGGVGGFPDYKNEYIVVMQHPVTTEFELSKKQIHETLLAIMHLNIPTFWFWPNIDNGADGTSAGIRSFREENKLPNVHFFKNMNPKDFLILLRCAKALIGNSSVGIRECAFLGVPTINIGSRQYKRARGENVIDVTYKKSEIIKAYESILKSKKPEPSGVYGGGNAGKNIAQILSEVELISHKTISY